ncbi:MAG: trypsin-like peptidase domain-containing protein [Desulfobacterales bacterium]|nr:trypsin-like peptidase domain-containing protein [Desulfobacterales bacterium]
MPKIIFALLLTVFTLFSPLVPHAYEATAVRRSAVVQAVEKASPAVVNISYTHLQKESASPFSRRGREEAIDRFFEDFFAPYHRNRQPSTTLGSGVIIDGEKGYILTNAHVIEKSGRITVRLQDNREFQATLTGSDQASDLAVLKVESETPLPSIAMGQSHDLMIGETVIAIGNPFGFSHTVSTGVVSAVDRNIRASGMVFRNFIQIDAAINPGNSGGPLLNILGELIGINTAIYEKAQGIGFTIPIDTARRVVSDLIEYGEVVEAWTGLELQEVRGSLAQYYGAPQDRGVVVVGVEDESPAQKANIAPGDLLLSFAGKPLQNLDTYHQLKRSIPSKGNISLTIKRGQTHQKIELTTTTYPLKRGEKLAQMMFGIGVKKSETNQGVLIQKISKESALWQVGVRKRDLIRRINDKVITSLESFYKTLIKFRRQKNLVFLIVRDGRGYYINVESLLAEEKLN